MSITSLDPAVSSALDQLPRDEVDAIVTSAADWLAENPGRHTSHVLASKTLSGAFTHPSDPDAFCFCAFGRLAKEIGERVPLPFSETDAHRTAIFYDATSYLLHRTYGTSGDHIVGMNDSEGATGRSRAIRAMRLLTTLPIREPEPDPNAIEYVDVYPEDDNGHP